MIILVTIILVMRQIAIVVIIVIIMVIVAPIMRNMIVQVLAASRQLFLKAVFQLFAEADSEPSLF